MQEPISPSLNPQTPSSSKKLPVIVIAIILAALIGGFLILRQPKKTQETNAATATPSQPTPTEKPKIDKKTVKIQVLNGTGTPGQAGKAVEELKKAGYDANNIKTANASDFNHSVTNVAAKSGFEDIANDVKQALSTIFDNVQIDSTTLSKDGEFDIVVTTGGKKFEEPTSTPKPTSQVASPTNTPTPTVAPTNTPTPTP